MSPRGRPGSRGSGRTLLPAILPALGAVSLDARVLPEPDLEFGHSQKATDPRIGLGMYGPYDITDQGRRSAIRVGIIGTGECIELVHQWIERCRGRVAPIRRVTHKGQLKAIPM